MRILLAKLLVLELFMHSAISWCSPLILDRMDAFTYRTGARS